MNMSNKIPKDHYIPQFYLDAFAIEGPGKERPHIFQYMEEKIVPPRIKDVASEKHFYTFQNTETNEPDRAIDDLLTMIETGASSPLKKIINNQCINLTTEEREILSSFFAVLVTRTPGFIQSQKNSYEETTKEYYAFAASHPEHFKKMMEQSGVDVANDDIEGLRDFAQQKRYSIEFSKSNDYFLATGLEVAMQLAEFYHKLKHWHLVITKEENDFFITSDNPISIYRPIDIPPIYNAGYGTGTLMIPISPNITLLMRDTPLKNEIIYVNSYFVNKINKNTIRFSNNYIYANQSTRKMEMLFQKTQKKEFQKFKIQKMKWAPFMFMGHPPVPEEIIKK